MPEKVGKTAGQDYGTGMDQAEASTRGWAGKQSEKVKTASETPECATVERESGCTLECTVSTCMWWSTVMVRTTRGKGTARRIQGK